MNCLNLSSDLSNNCPPIFTTHISHGTAIVLDNRKCPLCLAKHTAADELQSQLIQQTSTAHAQASTDSPDDSQVLPLSNLKPQIKNLLLERTSAAFVGLASILEPRVELHDLIENLATPLNIFCRQFRPSQDSVDVLLVNSSQLRLKAGSLLRMLISSRLGISVQLCEDARQFSRGVAA
ncbi:MAG: hypothetical protein R3C59_17695 [Planctomycetaceae bacterium]